MKIFTEPTGKFRIEIPNEWHYVNTAMGLNEDSPFNFELLIDTIGVLQLHCQSESGIYVENSTIHKYDTKNLSFTKNTEVKGKQNFHSWFALVETHIILAQYIYDTENENTEKVKNELSKVELSLSSLEFLSPARRIHAIEWDRYIKFMSSLYALRDLKNKALEKVSLFEIIVIVALEIDAYLRLAIIMTKQLEEKSNRIDLSLLYQKENDNRISERKIYLQAKALSILSPEEYDKLSNLYEERNKVIHRYVITDLKTYQLSNISVEFIKICQVINSKLTKIEERQYFEKIGIHANSKSPHEKPDDEQVQNIISLLNEKHLIKEMFREARGKDSN